MSTALTIRRGERSDRPFVLDLGQRVSSTSVSMLRDTLPQLVATAFLNLAEFVWTRDHDMLIAEADGVVAGFVLAIYDLPDEVSLTDQTFVAYMAVEPAAQRRGIGKALLEEVERLSAERGLSYVSLMVTEQNTAARVLYERAGFGTERRMLTKNV
jgi:ribosomal protein S18 acetylase RimI-like enzyme